MKTKSLIFFAFFAVRIYAQDVNITGNIQLENSTEFENIEIRFHQSSPNVFDSVTQTNTLGNYSIILPQGVYDIEYKKQGFDLKNNYDFPLFSDLQLDSVILKKHNFLIRVPIDFDSIHKAINFSIDGDTIVLDEGLYTTPLSFANKAITIASNYIIDGDTSHISKTIFDGQNASRQLTINNSIPSKVNLIGLCFKNGMSTKALNGQGGAIYCMRGSLRINKCVFENNRCEPTLYDAYGGAIYIVSGNELTIENSLFENNSATPKGTYDSEGGAINSRVNYLTLKNTIFKNNISQYAGAIDAYSNKQITIDSCIFDSNLAIEGNAGAASLVYIGKVDISNSTFKMNSAVTAAGAFHSSGKVNLKNCKFVKNQSSGPTVNLISSLNNITNCIFIDNYVENSQIIEGIYNLPSYFQATINHCLFAYNKGVIGDGSTTISNRSVFNSIFYNNDLQFRTSDKLTSNNLYFPKSHITQINPNFGSISTINQNKDSCDIYKNIFVAPEFEDTIYYRLTSSSKGIDAGNNDSLPSSDYFGNFRKYDGNNDSIATCDIGIHEFGSKKVDNPTFQISDQYICHNDTLILNITFPNGYNYIWNNGVFEGPVLKTDTAGTYHLSYLNEGVLYTSNNFNVSINPLPQPKISPDFSTVYVGEVINYNLDKEFESYIWNTGETQSNIEFVGNQDELGYHEIWCIVTDQNQCSDTAFAYVEIIEDVSNAIYYDSQSKYSVLPNPTSDILNILTEEQIEYLQILDFNGKQVLTQESDINTSKINVEKLPSGTYFLKIHSKKSTVIKPFIKY